jgi:carbon-monoxide dehydrogenase large subunit
MSILGNRVVRQEDPRLLTAGGSYVEDLALPGASFVAFVRSNVAHGRIRSIDATAARSAPGVREVLTLSDMDPPPARLRAGGAFPEAMRRPVLAEGTVRYVGEPIAAVVAETRAAAIDAAEAVVVDIEELPAVVDPAAALEDETVLFPEHGSNLALRLEGPANPELFAGCDVVVRQRLVNQRLAPCSLEVRAMAATRGDDGRLWAWMSTQNAHISRDLLARALGIDAAAIRVRTPDVGGGFGAKGGQVYPEEVVVAWLAWHRGGPYRFVETRSESMVNLGHGRAQHQEVTIGARRDGTVLAYRLDVVQDVGAYPSAGAILPVMTRLMASGVYRIGAVEFASRHVVTNTTPTAWYRGAGRPEATYAIERAMDLLARELEIDPVELRRRNLVPPDAFPYRTPTGAEYDSGDYARALELLLQAADYEGLRAEQARRRRAGARPWLGVGVSVYVEVTNPGGAPEFGALEVLAGGRVRLRAGTSAHGQGHATAFAMLAADALGVPIERIELVTGDTDLVPRGGGTSGSRSLQSGGAAVAAAAAEVVRSARELAADVLEAHVDDVELVRGEGRFVVRGTPSRGVDWVELAEAAVRLDRRDALAAEVDFRPGGQTYPFGAHLAVVEVDDETGFVRLARLVAVDDAGRILNPLLAEGQVHGGLAQGAAQALYEEMAYDELGNPRTGTLAEYAFPSAAELPSFELVASETPTPHNPLGAKGIGESGTLGSTPAIASAVVDALGHLGVTHVEMPATPERIWRAIEAARAGSERATGARGGGPTAPTR